MDAFPALQQWFTDQKARDTAYSHRYWFAIAAVLGLFSARRIYRLAISYHLDRFQSTQTRYCHSAWSRCCDLKNQNVLWLTIPNLNISIGEALLVVAYLATAISFAFVNTPNPPIRFYDGFTDRCGYLAYASMPWVVALAGKNNLVSLLTGVPYPRLQLYHQWAARTTMFYVLVHAVERLKSSVISAQLQETHIRFGLVGFVAFGIIFLVGQPIVMVRLYDLFYAVHTLGVIVAIVAAWYHQPSHRIWVECAIGIWALDRTARLLRLVLVNQIWRGGRKAIPLRLELVSADTIRLELARPGMPYWAPGSHAFLSAPALSWFPQGHPFSIAAIPYEIDASASYDLKSRFAASDDPFNLVLTPRYPGATSRFDLSPSVSRCIFPGASSSEALNPLSCQTPANAAPGIVRADTLTFIIRARNGWTRRLYDECRRLETEGRAGAPEVAFSVDGPYAPLERPLHVGFDSVLLFSGGSGVSWAISLLLDLVRRKAEATDNEDASGCSVRRVIFVWIVRSRKHFEWLEKELFYVLACAPPGFLTLDLYETRTARDPASSRRSSQLVRHQESHTKHEREESTDVLPLEPTHVLRPRTAGDLLSVVESAARHTRADATHVRLTTGRPAIGSIVAHAAARSQYGRLFVGSSGPAALHESVRKATAASSGRGADMVLHQEEFGW